MEGNHLHFIDVKTEAPQGFRPGKTGVGRIPRKSNQGLNFNHGKSSLGLQLRSRDTGRRGHPLGWEPQAEESESKRTLGLGPAICLGHCFLIIKLSPEGDLGAQGRFLLSRGKELSLTKKPETSTY